MQKCDESETDLNYINYNIVYINSVPNGTGKHIIFPYVKFCGLISC